MKKLYRVVASQVCYSAAFIEAESEEEAMQLAYDSEVEPEWKDIDFVGWQLEEAKLWGETA